jgi:hypothetical protein
MDTLNTSLDMGVFSRSVLKTTYGSGQQMEPIDWLPWAGMLVSALTLWGAMHFKRLQRLIADTPTSKTIGVFLGMVEVKGTAETEHPLTAFLSESRCVYHTWSVTERWSRMVTETYTDSKGRSRTRRRRKSGWTTVATGGEQHPFYLQDDRGVIRIVPDGAKFEPLSTFSRTCGPSDPLYYSKGPQRAIMHSDHVRCFTESAIPLHTPLYVFGTARQRTDIVAAEIANDKNSPLFLISTREKQSIHRGMAAWYWCLGILAGLLAVAGWIGPGYIETEQVDVPLALYAAGGFLVVWCLCWVWTVYNSLARLRQRVRKAWSHIDIELKRRHDLIPQLERVVKGLRDYERKVQTELAHIRTQGDASAPGDDGPDPEPCTRDLVAIAEAYPELKASDAFLKLQKQLSTTEERIALARTYFNDIASFFNMRLEVIPDRYVAAMAGLKPRELMQARGFERSPVQVDLAD